MQIYKQVLKEDESLCKPKDIVNAFPETKRFMDRYGKYCVCTKFTSGRHKIRLYSDKYEYIMVFIICLCSLGVTFYLYYKGRDK